MPDRFGFTHETHRGRVFHRCVDCDEFPWGVWVSERNRERHHHKHAREREARARRARLEALKDARRLQRQSARENVLAYEETGGA